MRRLNLLLILLLAFSNSQAQRITRQYNNVSLSEALFQLSQEQNDYTISFIYNELEDFRISTSVNRKSLPDAIQQMIGFYPIRMIIKPEYNTLKRLISRCIGLNKTYMCLNLRVNEGL